MSNKDDKIKIGCLFKKTFKKSLEEKFIRIDFINLC